MKNYLKTIVTFYFSDGCGSICTDNVRGSIEYTDKSETDEGNG